MRPRDLILIFACLAIVCILPLQAQQKGQWVPGQMGLNAGVTPEPGFTYSNMAINYSASKLNDSNGNALPGITGTYAFWVDENVVEYVPKFKILPFYSVHGIGFQSTFILPKNNLALFFKYYDEYSAKAHPVGRTIVFGGSWTLRNPKPATP